jgi:hypothetical protein
MVCFYAGAEAPAYLHPSPRDDKMCTTLLNHAKNLLTALQVSMDKIKKKC